MLSMDNKQYLASYGFVSGMLNIAWVAGYTHLPDDPAERRKLVYVWQTNNLNHALPVHMRDGTILPSRFEERTEIKATCRVTGRRLEDGNRIAVLEALDFTAPTVLDMPPEDNWTFDVPKDAPQTDFKPSKTGLALSRRANVVRLAGFVAGIQLTAPGLVKANGNVSNGRLELLIAQRENLDLAIPVRIDGKFAEAIHRVIKMGMPLLINDGQFKVNVDKTGEPPNENGISPVRFLPYIEARVPQIATRDKDIMGEVPAWAKALASGQRARRSVATTGGAEAASAAPPAAPQPPRVPAGAAPGRAGVTSLDDAIHQLDG